MGLDLGVPEGSERNPFLWVLILAGVVLSVVGCLGAGFFGGL